MNQPQPLSIRDILSEMQGVTVIEHTDFVDTLRQDEMPELAQTEVILKAQAIAAIQTGDGTSSLVAFHPTAATLSSVKNYEGWDVDLVLDDKNGIFKPQRPQRITGHIWCDNTRMLIIETEDQE